MSVEFKILNGTPKHGKSLCETCKWSHIVHGFAESEVMVRCGAHRHTWSDGDESFSPGYLVITRPVAECSAYVDKRVMSLDQMKKLALTIDTERVRVQGFAPPKTS
jgi:hypothetical protein